VPEQGNVAHGRSSHHKKKNGGDVNTRATLSKSGNSAKQQNKTQDQITNITCPNTFPLKCCNNFSQAAQFGDHANLKESISKDGLRSRLPQQSVTSFTTGGGP
jgi:hypothetical protein